MPTLKKSGLDVDFKNFRPVSNLPYILKLLKIAVAHQVMQHMAVNNLNSLFQSAYKPNHSTETTLLKVKNDTLLNMNDQDVTLLILLDLSAAFDTINHDILIARLESEFSIKENALAWLKSYCLIDPGESLLMVVFLVNSYWYMGYLRAHVLVIYFLLFLLEDCFPSSKIIFPRFIAM